MCIQTLSSFRQTSLKAYLKTNLSSWHLSWFDWQLYHPWFKSMHNTYFSLEKIKILSFFTIMYPIHSLHPFQDTNWWVCSINLLSSDIPPINCTIGRHITLHILIYQGYINLERLPYMPIKATTTKSFSKYNHIIPKSLSRLYSMDVLWNKLILA